MATKTLTITAEAYARLAAHKGQRESFSDVINTLTGKRSLLDLAGILSEKQADKLEHDMSDMRKRAGSRLR